MMHFIKVIFYISTVIFSHHSVVAQSSQKTGIELSDARNFGDTLYLKYQDIECGEFGGHQELLRVYSKQGYLYVTFQKFDADCSKIREYNGVPLQILKTTIAKVLSEKEQFDIEDYVEKTVNTPAKPLDDVKWGYSLQIIKKDRNINLLVSPADDEVREYYLALVDILFKS